MNILREIWNIWIYENLSLFYLFSLSLSLYLNFKFVEISKICIDAIFHYHMIHTHHTSKYENLNIYLTYEYIKKYEIYMNIWKSFSLSLSLFSLSLYLSEFQICWNFENMHWRDFSLHTHYLSNLNIWHIIYYE